MSEGALRGLVRCGWLAREHRGVYRVGPEALGLRGRWAAALLAVGRGSALSHRTAAEAYGWLDPALARPVHVTAPVKRRAPSGVVVHRAPLAGERTRHGGFPVTSVERTLSDLAGSERPDVVGTAVHEAEVQRRLRPVALAAARRRPGAPVLRALASDRLPIEGDVREKLERDFGRFRHHRGYPVARTNAWLELRDPRQWVRLDVLWEAYSLGVELDGRAVHATQRAFDEDRRRDRRVAAQHGIEVVRVTWNHLHREADELDADLRALLARARRHAGRPAP